MKKKITKTLAVVLCMALPSALYAYFHFAWEKGAETTDYIVMAGLFLPWVIILGLLQRLTQENAERSWTRDQTRRLVLCALLTALGVVLGGFLSIPAMPLGVYSLKIGFGVLPVLLAGVLFGPAYGAMVGALTDFLQAMIAPKGAYVPFFTVIGALFGLIPGLFFARGQEPKFLRVLAAVATGQTIASVVLNSLLLIWLYALPWETFIPRMINQAVMIPVYSLLVYGLVKLLNKAGIAPRRL